MTYKEIREHKELVEALPLIIERLDELERAQKKPIARRKTTPKSKNNG